jgi:hypothetical protein
MQAIYAAARAPAVEGHGGSGWKGPAGKVVQVRESVGAEFGFRVETGLGRVPLGMIRRGHLWHRT